MIVDFDLNQMKEDSVLYLKEGKVICLPKDEFLKGINDKVKKAEDQVELLTNKLALYVEYVNNELDEFKKEMNEYKKTIYEFLTILKGGNNNA